MEKVVSNIMGVKQVLLYNVISTIRSAKILHYKNGKVFDCKQHLAKEFLDLLRDCDYLLLTINTFDGEFGKLLRATIGDYKRSTYISQFVQWFLDNTHSVDYITKTVLDYLNVAPKALDITNLFKFSTKPQGKYILCYTSDMRITLNTQFPNETIDWYNMFIYIRNKVSGEDYERKSLQSWTTDITVALYKYGYEFVYSDKSVTSTPYENTSLSIIDTRVRKMQLMLMPINCFFIEAYKINSTSKHYICIPFDKAFDNNYYEKLKATYTEYTFNCQINKFSIYMNSLKIQRGDTTKVNYIYELSTYRLFGILGAKGSSYQDSEVITSMSVSDFTQILNKDCMQRNSNFAPCSAISCDIQTTDRLRYWLLCGVSLPHTLVNAQVKELFDVLKKHKKYNVNSIPRLRKLLWSSPVLKYNWRNNSTDCINDKLSNVLVAHSVQERIALGYELSLFSKETFDKYGG